MAARGPEQASTASSSSRRASRRVLATARRELPIGIVVLVVLVAVGVVVGITAQIATQRTTRLLALDGANTTSQDGVQTTAATYVATGHTEPGAEVRWEVDGVRSRTYETADEYGRFELQVPIDVGPHVVRISADTPPLRDREDEVAEVRVTRASDPPATPRLLGLERSDRQPLLTIWSEPGTTLESVPRAGYASSQEPGGRATIQLFDEQVTSLDIFAVNSDGHRSAARHVDLLDPEPRLDGLVPDGPAPRIDTTVRLTRSSATRSIHASLPAETAGLNGILVALRQGDSLGSKAPFGVTPLSVAGGANPIDCDWETFWSRSQPPKVTAPGSVEIQDESQLEYRWAGPVATDSNTIRICAPAGIPSAGTDGSLELITKAGLIERAVPEPTSVETRDGEDHLVFATLRPHQVVTLSLVPVRAKFAESFYTDFVTTGNTWGVDSVLWSAAFSVVRLIPILLLLGLAVSRTSRSRRSALAVISGVIVLVPMLALGELVANAFMIARVWDAPENQAWLSGVASEAGLVLTSPEEPWPAIRSTLITGSIVALAVVVVPWLALRGRVQGVGKHLSAITITSLAIVIVLLLVELAVSSGTPENQPSNEVLVVAGFGLGLLLMGGVSIRVLRSAARELGWHLPMVAWIAVFAVVAATVALWLAPETPADAAQLASSPGGLLRQLEMTARRSVYVVWLVLPLLIVGLAIDDAGRRPWERWAKTDRRETTLLVAGAVLFSVFLAGFRGYVLGLPLAPLVGGAVFYFVLLESVRNSRRLALQALTIRGERSTLLAAALSEGKEEGSTEEDGEKDEPPPQAAPTPPAAPAYPTRAIQAVLALPPRRYRAANTRLGVQVAGLLSLLLLPLYLAQLDTTTAWQSLALGLVAFMVRWLLIGALLGLLFEYIRGQTGLAKGVWLGVALLLVRVPFDLVELSLGWTTIGVVTFSMLQTMAVATAVGLAFDVTTIRRSRAGRQRRWVPTARDALSLSGGKYVVAFATTLASGAVVALTAQLGSGLGQVMTSILSALAPTPFPPR